MTHHKKIQLSWLMITRGVFYVCIGIAMFFFSDTYSAQIGYVISFCVLAAGSCQLYFSVTNSYTDSNYSWGLLHGVADVAFSIAIFGLVKGPINDLVDVLGFWAMVYAFLQAVPAMYIFIGSPTGKIPNRSTALIHLLNVFVAGGLAFNLLLRPADFNDSLGFSGLFPVLLGGLIIVLANRLRESVAIKPAIW